MPKATWWFAALGLVSLLACAGNSSDSSTPASVSPSSPDAMVAAKPGTLSLTKAFPALTFDNPTDMQAPPDETNRLFVLEQGGVIRVFENSAGVQSAKVFLDLRDRVASGGEMGLLGLAFHPDFATNRTFYVNYTAGNPRRTVIARYRQQQADPNLADPKEEVLLTFEQPFSNHNGGQLAFGPDGYLYIGTGDGGGAGDLQNNAQNRKNVLGDWLRIDVNTTSGDRAYGIPADNPYAGNTEGFREEIYAYGLRNLWRFSYDADTQRWYGADVGQNRQEEINILEKGKNYGWRIMEGDSCFINPVCDKTGLTLPIATYGRSLGQSVTGGYVFRGQAAPSLVGYYVYADFVSGRVWKLKYDGAKTVENTMFLESGLNIASFGVDAQRELYALAFDGSIYRFTE